MLSGSVRSKHFDASDGSIWTHARRLFCHRLIHAMWFSRCWGLRAGCVLVCRIFCCACACRCRVHRFLRVVLPSPLSCGSTLSSAFRHGISIVLFVILSPKMVSHWTFLRDPWTLHCNSWIQSGVLPRLMANHGWCACGARVCGSCCDWCYGERLVCYAVALALEEIGGQEVLQPAAARAAADSDHDAHTFLATSEAPAFEGLHCVMAPQAAAARVAAYFSARSLCLVRPHRQHKRLSLSLWVLSLASRSHFLQLHYLRGVLANIFWCTCSSLAGSSLEIILSQLIDDWHWEDTKVRRIERLS